LVKARAVLPISARYFRLFPSDNSLAIQTAEFVLTNAQFRIPCFNYNIQTAP
jgi:hypothetical protein